MYAAIAELEPSVNDSKSIKVDGDLSLKSTTAAFDASDLCMKGFAHHHTDYMRQVTFVNRLLNDRIGMGKVQWQIFVLAGWGWLCDNMWMNSIALVLPAIATQWPDSPDVRWLTFSLLIGLTFGAAFWSVMADYVGRRLSFNVTLLLCGLAGVVCGTASSFPMLALLLSILGFGLGGNLPVDAMLFLEFVPASHQYLLTLLSIFWSFGQLLVTALAWPLLGSERLTCPEVEMCDYLGNIGWRILFYLLGAFTLLFSLMRLVIFQLPESPKFLLARGRNEDVVAVLRDLCRRNGREPISDLEVQGLRQSNVDGERRPKVDVGLRSLGALFHNWASGWSTVAIFLIWTLTGFAYPMYNAFLPLYLSKATTTTSLSATYRNLLIIAVCGIPGSAIAAWLVELPRAGRRGAMALGALATAIFLFLFTLVTSAGAVLAFNGITASTQNIMFGVLFAFTPEVFPGPVRGTADGLAAALNRVAGAFAPVIAMNWRQGDATAPVMISASLFLVAALLMVTIKLESQGKNAL